MVRVDSTSEVILNDGQNSPGEVCDGCVIKPIAERTPNDKIGVVKVSSYKLPISVRVSLNKEPTQLSVT